MRSEKQLQLIQERLHGIETNLANLTNSVTIAGQRSNIYPPSLDASQPNYNTRTTQVTSGFEGDSSFASTALFAKNVAERTSKEDVQTLENHEMIGALKSLKGVLESHRPGLSANVLHFPGYEIDSKTLRIEPPPVAFAVAIVKRFKGIYKNRIHSLLQALKQHTAQPTEPFLSCAWRDRDFLETLCQHVYFPSEPVSLGSLTLMYGLLWEQSQYICPEKDPEFSSFELSYWLRLCERNFYAGVESYEVLTSHSLENAQALTLGAMRALGLSRPFLCRTLLTAAANICVSLGYHRRTTLQGDRSLLAESKRHVFWQVYMMDKNISLSLGRASNLQDYDIDAELFEPSNDQRYRSYDLLCHAWIHFARLEGKVYDFVYSVNALAVSSEERSVYASNLAHELATWKENELEQICQGSHNHPGGLESQILSTYPTYYSVLTLLHRGHTDNSVRPTPLVSHVCLEAARQSVACHLKTIPRFIDYPGSRSTYVTWVLLYCSFTPFFMIFVNVLVSLDQEDLDLLRSLVEAIQSLATVSEGSKRLYSICRAFYQVAEIFIRSKHRNQTPFVHRRVPSSHSETVFDIKPHEGLDLTLSDLDLEGHGLIATDTQWQQSLFDLLNLDNQDIVSTGGYDT